MWPHPAWEATRRRHLSVFAGTCRYIPLGLSLRNRFSINRYEYFTDHRKMFENEMEKALAVRAIGSDMIPCLALRHDPVVLLSMFGGEVENIGGRPMAAPVFASLDAARKLEAPGLEAGILPEIARACRYFRGHAPPDVALCTPPETDPFDVLLLLFGSSIFVEMNDRPELVDRALDVITTTFIEVQRYLKALVGEPAREKVTYLGTCIPGIRVAADALVNLSPGMIRRFAWPVFGRLADAFGGVLVHYCPSPALKYYHVVPPLLDCPSVLGIDTSGGIDYFDSEENPRRLATGTALVAECAFTRPGQPPSEPDSSPNINRPRERSWDEIDAWLNGEFMGLSRQGRRGLILRACVPSIEEGRELYALWREKFEDPDL